VYVPLTAEQATLYAATVREALDEIEEAEAEGEAMQRRGKVLAMLVRLKQICNHPAHFLKDHSALEGRSGKLERLEEMLEEALAEGDRALIFTQFAEMGELLFQRLPERLFNDALFLHGGTPARDRESMVRRFQAEEGPGIFILSLKAGGVGLNLTKANHVFHFDRWWNPAVENQATDRAFRIGQMIERKRALAENVLGTGEGWLTELSTAQLRELVMLREDAIGE
jgi:SNF2 family DNA or RNA helicase